MKYDDYVSKVQRFSAWTGGVVGGLLAFAWGCAKIGIGAGVVFGALVLPCAAAVTAQPPAALPDKLKADTAALAADRAAAESTSTERAKLQADLRRLIVKIDRIPSGPGPMAPPVVPAPTAKGKDDGAAPVDRLRAATNHVRDNQYEVALGAFRLIDFAVDR